MVNIKTNVNKMKKKKNRDVSHIYIIMFLFGYNLTPANKNSVISNTIITLIKRITYIFARSHTLEHIAYSDL